MSANPSDRDASIEVVRGRRAPYTRVGDWVALAGISRNAKALYVLLAAHVNQREGSARPSRRALADLLGYAKVESVDPLLKELVRLKAIDVQRRWQASGAPAPNRYVVHETPPAGYDGPASLAEFYAARKTLRQGQEVALSTGVPPASGVAPQDGVPPCEGGRYPIPRGEGYPRGMGINKEEIQQDEVEPPPPPPPSPSPVPASVGAEHEVVVAPATPDEPTPDRFPAGSVTRGDQRDAATVVDETLLPATVLGAQSERSRAGQADPEIDNTEAVSAVLGADWPAGWTPTTPERAVLARAVRPCLRRGHPVEQVQAVMAGNLDGARNPVAVALTRLRKLAAAEPDPAAATRPGGPVTVHATKPATTSQRAAAALEAGRRLQARLNQPTQEITP